MKKLIVGFPGLTHSSEQGRLERISGAIPNTDFNKIEYKGITKKQNLVTIPLDIEQFSKGVRIPQSYDQIGVIASSTGAAVLSHYLSTHPEFVPDWYVAISPFCKLNQKAISQVAHLNQSQEDLPLKSMQGPERVIPNEYLDNLLSLDSNSHQSETKIPNVLTLIGSQDTIIDPQEARIHHYRFGGEETGIRVYSAQHQLNDQSTQDAIEFIRKVTRS